jgi:hypothetical protein
LWSHILTFLLRAIYSLGIDATFGPILLMRHRYDRKSIPCILQVTVTRRSRGPKSFAITNDSSPLYLDINIF